MSHAQMGRRLDDLSVPALTQNRKQLEAKMRDDPGLSLIFHGLTDPKTD
jgi:hypothetical protein